MFAPLPCNDALIVKSDPTGKPVFGTLLGGPTNDESTSLAIDQARNIYIIGQTGGFFPATPGAAIASSTTSHTFAAKLAADGSRFVYATYLPDSIGPLYGIAADAQGNAYVVGQTIYGHALVVKISADGSRFVYTVVLTGSNSENAAAVTADAAGNAFVTGWTRSPDFPTTVSAFQTRLAGAQNAFITRLDPTGNVVFSSYLGGSGKDYGSVIRLDPAGNIFVGGATNSPDFPTTSGAFEPKPLIPAWSDTPGGFLAKLTPGGASLSAGTYIWTGAPALALGPSGDIYVAGQAGPGFPVTPSAPMPCVPGSFDSAGGSVLAHFDGALALRDATYVSDDFTSGIALASDGSVWLSGVFITQVRFGGSGWSAPACLTPAVFNAASQNVAVVAPGEFITLFGHGIGPSGGVGGNGGGVQVLFDGVPAPVLYAQSEQVNAQAPFELSGRPSTSVTLTYNGVTFGPVTVPVRFADPGLFRLQPNTSSQVLAVNQDGTLNGPSSPAPRGSIVTMYATGLGSTLPACGTGALNYPLAANLAPGLELRIFDGGTVEYAGSAPTLYCGIFQVNMQVPADAQPPTLSLSPISVLTQPSGVQSFVGAAPVGSTLYIR
jgi:uncharacterized protein (TIGR03437 family)